MKSFARRGAAYLLLLSVPVVAGCMRTQGQTPPPPDPEVKVAKPALKKVRDFEDFPGRLEAVNSIDLRARVTGYLDKVNFTEGAEVQKGDVLFEIDPRSYEADLAKAEGNVVLSAGHLRRLETEYDRSASLRPKGIVGQEEYDKAAGDKVEAKGSHDVAQASREMARLNLSWTKVRSPLTGRISRRYLDPGNLVKADDTVLTTIVSLDPIYAYFDVDERTTLRLQRLIRDGKVKWSTDESMPVFLGLADEQEYPPGRTHLIAQVIAAQGFASAWATLPVVPQAIVSLGVAPFNASAVGFPLSGWINFADNRVDVDTGTWRLRAVVKNPNMALAPGLFVRVHLPIGTAFDALLVSEQALGTDQGQKYVCVVNKVEKTDAQGNKVQVDQVEYRSVKVGRLHDGLRVITEGLKAEDRIIVSGLQRVHPGSPVKAVELDHMPIVQGADAGH